MRRKLQGPLKRLEESVSNNTNGRATKYFAAAKERTSHSARRVTSKFNVSHGGISNVRKHLAIAKHQQLVKAVGNTWGVLPDVWWNSTHTTCIIFPNSTARRGFVLPEEYSNVP